MEPVQSAISLSTDKRMILSIYWAWAWPELVLKWHTKQQEARPVADFKESNFHVTFPADFPAVFSR